MTETREIRAYAKRKAERRKPLILDPEEVIAALDKPMTAQAIARKVSQPQRMALAALYSLSHDERVLYSTDKQGVRTWTRR